MTCLSIFGVEGPAKVVANPIYSLQDLEAADATGIYRFEVLDADAGDLALIIGEHHCFAIDDTVIWARLTALDPVKSSHPALAQLRGRRAFLGTLMIVPDLTSRHVLDAAR